MYMPAVWTNKNTHRNRELKRVFYSVVILNENARKTLQV